jgi:hypothetical protein
LLSKPGIAAHQRATFEGDGGIMQYQDHENTAAFRRMAHGDASPVEVRSIVRHLLGGCARCQRMADRVRRELTPSPDSNYDQVFDRVQRRVSRIVKPSARPRRCFGPFAAAHAHR